MAKVSEAKRVSGARAGGSRAGGSRDRACAGLTTALAAFALGLPVWEVRAATRRRAEAAFARQVAMYVAHVGFGMSMGRVALAFGRDKSTVQHACEQMEARRDERAFDRWINALEDAVRAAPAPVIETLLQIAEDA